MEQQIQTHQCLLQRYKQILNKAFPESLPVKVEQDSRLARLSVPHLLWMIEKMESPDFKPLTTTSAWISWIQAGLYFHNLINSDHEKDITREVLKQFSEG